MRQVTTDSQVPISSPAAAPYISVVIPVYDERGTVEELHRQLREVLLQAKQGFEIIFVDDGSRDGTSDILDRLAASDPCTRTLRFRSNRGKADALNLGFQAARGAVIVTLDADLQDLPSEIPLLLHALEHHDVVSGWKRNRHDPVSKTLPSRVFNWIVRRVFQLPLHDINSGLKAYRAEVIAELDLYGELHRFIPLLAAHRGFRVTEVQVNHAPRTSGVSKYGWTRVFRGGYDLLTMLLLTRFEHRPMHFLGAIGLVIGAGGLLVLGYLTVLRLAFNQSIGSRPLLVLGVLLLLAGVQLITTGFLGELMVRRTRPPRSPGSNLLKERQGPGS